MHGSLGLFRPFVSFKLSYFSLASIRCIVHISIKSFATFQWEIIDLNVLSSFAWSICIEGPVREASAPRFTRRAKNALLESFYDLP